MTKEDTLKDTLKFLNELANKDELDPYAWRECCGLIKELEDNYPELKPKPLSPEDKLVLKMHENKSDISVRKFNGLLFHGNGEDSKLLYDTLAKRLDYGHMLLSGLQQGVDTRTPEYKEEFEKVKDVCRDVLASFGMSDGGLQWNKLPYPSYNVTLEEEEEDDFDTFLKGK